MTPHALSFRLFVSALYAPLATERLKVGQADRKRCSADDRRDWDSRAQVEHGQDFHRDCVCCLCRVEGCGVARGGGGKRDTEDIAVWAWW